MFVGVVCCGCWFFVGGGFWGWVESEWFMLGVVMHGTFFSGGCGRMWWGVWEGCGVMFPHTPIQTKRRKSNAWPGRNKPAKPPTEQVVEIFGVFIVFS